MIRCAFFSMISLITFLLVVVMTNSSTAVPVVVVPTTAATSISASAATTTTTTTVSPTIVVPSSTKASFSPSSLLSHLKLKQPKTLLSSVLSPYRFSFSHSSAAAALPPKKGTITTTNTMKSSAAPSTATTEKNWLLTKAWLIDNINRLRREMSELERDYSAHLDAAERTSQAKDRQLVEDLTKLRADHSLLSQQQKQIIYLIKRAKLSKSSKLSSSENDIRRSSSTSAYQLEKVADSPQQQQLTATASQRRSPVVKRAISDTGSERFQATTRHNMEEVFSELSALHDLTLTLFTDMRAMEHRLAIREKFQ